MPKYKPMYKGDAIVDAMRGHPAITTNQISEISDVDRRTVSDKIKTLVHRGLVEVVGYMQRMGTSRQRVYRLKKAIRA